jgi:hypothetical protein
MQIRKFFFVPALALAMSPAFAQTNSKVQGNSQFEYARTATYGGEEISLSDNVMHSTFLGKLDGNKEKGYSYQGMDIYGNWLVSLQNQGYATVYSFDGKQFKKKDAFDLASKNPLNHANVASFGVEKAQDGDPMPVLYVSQCNKKTIDGMKDVAYVERILPDLSGSELVQTINFKDDSHLFGYALQWVVDHEGCFLYGYGNTINNDDPANRHRIIKFRLPKLSEGPYIELTDKDILETYLIEDYDNSGINPVGQGLLVKNGMLIMPVGVGKPEKPSYILVWDLVGKRMRNVLDAREITKTELEDAAVYDGDLILHSQGGLWKIEFDED